MQVIKTLEDLKHVTHAYDDFETIEGSSIPQYYKDIFPKTCTCGAEMILTEPKHTQLQCCNPACWVKMAHRLNYFISYHGFKGFGEQACYSIFVNCHNELQYASFLGAFLLSRDALNRALTPYQLELFLEIKETLSTHTYHFCDAIASLGIPNIGSRSVLFDYVKGPSVLMNYVLDNKTEELCDMIGINAVSTRYYLKAAAADIVLLMSDVMPGITATPKGEIFVAITGKVSVGGVAYTRAEFIALCESFRDAEGTQLYKLIETKAQDKLQYVIADAPSDSDKYRIGLRLNKLITAEEFYKMLKDGANPPDDNNPPPPPPPGCQPGESLISIQRREAEAQKAYDVQRRRQIEEYERRRQEEEKKKRRQNGNSVAEFSDDDYNAGCVKGRGKPHFVPM